MAAGGGGTYNPKIELYRYLIPGHQNYQHELMLGRKVKPSLFDKIVINETKESKLGKKTLPTKDFVDNGRIFSNDVIFSGQKMSGGYRFNHLYRNYLGFPTMYNDLRFFNSDVLPVDNISKEEFISLMKMVYTFNTHYYNLRNTESKFYYSTKDDGFNPDDINGFIHKHILPENTKVIIFGDHHGGYHTLFRNLIRLHIAGVVDLINFKVRDGYTLLFLGDLIDRGIYSVEIIYVLLKFVYSEFIKFSEEDRISEARGVANNYKSKILIIRGNHETMDYQINHPDTLEKEMVKKEICIDKELIEGKININEKCEINNLLNNYFATCPSAIILSNGIQNFYCCHGGFTDSEGVLDLISNLTDKSNIILNQNENSDVLWSDFNKSFEDKKCDEDSSRHIGCEYGPVNLDKFFEKTKINFMIRGHQDLFGNCVIFHSGDDYPLETIRYYKGPPEEDIEGDLRSPTHGINLDYKHPSLENKTNPYGFYQNKNAIGQNHYDGPIYKFDCLNIKVPFKKLLTISTNTDFGRGLESDGFITLDMFNRNDITDFRNNDIKYPLPSEAVRILNRVLTFFRGTDSDLTTNLVIHGPHTTPEPLTTLPSHLLSAAAAASSAGAAGGGGGETRILRATNAPAAAKVSSVESRRKPPSSAKMISVANPLLGIKGGKSSKNKRKSSKSKRKSSKNKRKSFKKKISNKKNKRN
jgi:hypothetical protein